MAVRIHRSPVRVKGDVILVHVMALKINQTRTVDTLQ
jgi:hypothetical protein